MSKSSGCCRFRRHMNRRERRRRYSGMEEETTDRCGQPTDANCFSAREKPPRQACTEFRRMGQRLQPGLIPWEMASVNLRYPVRAIAWLLLARSAAPAFGDWIRNR